MIYLRTNDEENKASLLWLPLSPRASPAHMLCLLSHELAVIPSTMLCTGGGPWHEQMDGVDQPASFLYKLPGLRCLVT